MARRARRSSDEDSDDEEKPRGKRRSDEAIDIPYDPVGEQVLLAAAIVDREARKYLVGRVRSEQMSVPEHILAWTHVVLPMSKDDMEYDPAAVQQLCAGKVDSSYLIDLAAQRDEAPERANLAFHVDRLAWDSARMTTVKGPLASLLAALRDPHTNPDRVKALAGQVHATISAHSGRSFIVDSSALALTQLSDIDERIGGRAVFPLGIPGLDTYEESYGVRDGSGNVMANRPRLVPGTKPGFTTVVTAVSGHGKSTTTVNAALGIIRGYKVRGRRKRRKVLYGAWEMSGGMTLELLACQSLGFSRTALMTGQVTVEERARIYERMEQIGEYVKFMKNPFMAETSMKGKRPDVWRNMDIIERHISDSGCDVFIADLWERCLVTDDPGEEKQALWHQQNMHERLQIHGILLQQQNKQKLLSRRDKWPTQETIFGSGAWVDIADTLIGWNNPSLWKNVPNTVIEAHVLKQRWGPYPLLVELEWNPDTGILGKGTSVPYPRGESGGGGGDSGGGSVFEPPRRGRRPNSRD